MHEVDIITYEKTPEGDILNSNVIFECADDYDTMFDNGVSKFSALINMTDEHV